jgi:hypothetical protein
MERIIIIVLMALGLGATATVIVRSVKSAHQDLAVDPMRARLFVITICRVEDFILISAACLPFLKGPFEQCLHTRFGVKKFLNIAPQLDSDGISA